MVNSKGEQTKALILEKASKIFNSKGYRASSISDIMHETGLRKGGIYNHFENKEEIMLSAFSFSIDMMRHLFSEAMAGKQGCLERLLSIVSVFEEIAEKKLFPGGCPIMNAAIEADDADPLLQEKVREAMDGLLGMVRNLVQEGINKGEIKQGVDPEFVATVFISTLEGALALSKLYKNQEYMKRAVHHLRLFLNQTCS
ncbi:TetR/AcrR family transcriptional regulator [Priestia megaterium]|uniref:TetR/AcrR family transcriptional regulator n=1 Tax=Priestia megaterium TaxID=1404 RepID=UPI0013E3D88A|nr:TetR/AcrR family transcriptional regulator [Priestia megaterium]MED3865041.1 TetR/AcrR family transcriptional regulator [Priestia megaterium]MED4098579.1 TetR/AcrR family transcriptional regulator [Priestia megaterium]MED4145800.1 TetR/AcrR family transcriptional regulator [Priestia megaterium]MED4168866.1 TetR/AcrR family transcriptional regulator [Priestia megaterium]MED4198579.1 TetR/AcrR family transcriptional regulator [Priestia megaterium]